MADAEEVDQNIRIIREFLSELQEEDLYEPLRDLFMTKGYQVWITHGSHEHGKDLVATKNGHHNLKINVKKGDIDAEKWRTDVFTSLSETMVLPINHTEVDEKLPWKPILIFNGIMTAAVDQKLKGFNEDYRKNNKPEVEVWDINKLSTEFNSNLLSSDLLARSYLEDIQRLILSISEDHIDLPMAQKFVDDHLSLQKEKFLAFRLAILYVLRRSENKRNIYAFFNVAEYALIRIWSKLYRQQDFSMIDHFDTIHKIYLNSLENWSSSIIKLASQPSGLVDLKHGCLSEILTYSLRTTDVIRRLSYIAYVYFLKQRESDARKYVKSLLKVIKNNKSAYAPMCEFNYNDIGLALTVLRLGLEEEEAKEWMFGLADFLISHYRSGYELLPLGEPTERMFEAILRKRQAANDIKSHIFPLIFEFAILFDYQEIYTAFVPLIPQDVSFREVMMPDGDQEEEIYDKQFMNSVDIFLPSKSTWPQWKLSYNAKRKGWATKFSAINHGRPFVLSIVSNVYRDRYFPSLWRDLDRARGKEGGVLLGNQG